MRKQYPETDVSRLAEFQASGDVSPLIVIPAILPFSLCMGAYLAIIACLLILIYTGRAPTKRTFKMICLSMSGWASLAELERHIEKLRPTKK